MYFTLTTAPRWCPHVGEMNLELMADLIIELFKNDNDWTRTTCYDWFSSPVGTENRGGSEVEEILTAAYREFGGCAHRCAGKPKRREQDQASREEGDTPDREQQKNSCLSRATSVGFGQGVGHLPVSVT